jgi:general secretion pathway protein D
MEKGMHALLTRYAIGVRRIWLLALLCLPIPALHAESMTLNLKDADINAVISTVAEMTGKNFIVDPRVKGKVTVISARPMNADEIYQVFLSVLNVNGFAAIPGKNAIKIVPEVDAKQDAVRTTSDENPGRGDEYVTRVIQLHNIAATQLVPVVRPLLPQEAHLAAYPDTNVLVVSASAATVERMAQIVKRIDLATSSDVEVIRLSHASADEVARILTSVTSDPSKGGQAGGLQQKIIADARTNTVLLSGDKATRLRLKAIITHLDLPLEQSGNSRVIYLRYANAKDLVPVLSGVSASMAADAKNGGSAPVSADGKTVIQAHEETNSLVIHAAPDVMRDLETVIRQIDIKRSQVLVNAIIAEVSSEKAAELGVQWLYDGSPENAPVGVINFGGSGSGLANLLATPPIIGDGISLAVGDTGGSGVRIGALLRALGGDGETNILSTPTLVTLDNQEAEIVVGQNVPFVTGSYSSTGTSTTPTNPFQTIQRQDVGLKLKIKPQINEGSAIRLDIDQEVSSLTSGTSGAADLITNKRALKTSVMVDDGEVIVLGGLVDDTLNESVQKVPVLGDIPVLGYLFSYRKSKKVKRNLMAFIHPVILRDSSQSMALSGEKYNQLRAEQLGIRKRGVELLPDEASPLMPEMEQWMALPPPYKEKEAKASVTEQSPAPSNEPSQPAAQ